ncbi:MAG TPA: hypothetical protein VHZ25_00770 [Acidobacteriaceae bacterium]|jgi:hypothetical protein|nr:hypothetical protein [Acidobacteriaceae bacterium]
MPVLRRGVPGFAVLLCVWATPLRAQSVSQDELAKKVQLLTDAVGRAQSQVEESQKELTELRRQLDEVRMQMNGGTADADPPADAEQLAAQVEALKENQAMQQSQIATHEQSKVESASKYPVKVSGLILLNAFVNTKQVDMPATPTIALGGSGSTGATMRQTVLGINARGPHVFGAESRADVQTDFFGSTGGSTTYDTAGLLRLRTAHADLDWDRTEVFFSMDRPLINPTQPDSLTAVAVPPLSWSGNLWTWNPQFGVTYDQPLGSRERLRMQGALIDVADPPYTTTNAVYPVTTAELGRWPGAEARLAITGNREDRGFQLGASGFFAEHRTAYGTRFDSWAGALDYRQPLPGRMELSGNAYRGLALGGLGGSAYKDYGVRADPDNPGRFYVRAFDDVGGWAQLKERASERVELNGAFGLDNVPARQVARYAGVAMGNYQYLARTQTFMGNVIYSPSAWLQFSVEYRRLGSFEVNAPTAASNIVGVAAGYKF